MSKRRITVTVDDAILTEVSGAVMEGRAESVSAWINEAMSLRLARDRRLHLLAELVAEYESEHGEFTESELAEQRQRDQDEAAATRARVRRAG